jgi:hypothetical protein
LWSFALLFYCVGLTYSANNSYTPPDITSNICYNSISLDGNLQGLFEYSDATGWDIRIGNGNAIIKNNIILNNGFVTTEGPYLGTGSYIKVGPDATVDVDYNCYLYLRGLFDAIWINETDNNSQILEDGKGSVKNRENLQFRGISDIDAYRLSAYPNEQHSIFKSVNFADVTTGNLHLAGSSIGDIDLAGTHIP